jgi:hypothetical protein
VGIPPAHTVLHDTRFPTTELGSCCDHAQPWLALSADITEREANEAISTEQATFAGKQCAAVVFGQMLAHGLSW